MAIHPTAEFWNELKLNSKSTQHLGVSEWLALAEICNALEKGSSEPNRLEL